MGGPSIVRGVYDASVHGMGLRITVLDKETGSPIQGATVSLTGLDWQNTGTHVALNLDLKTDSTGKVKPGLSMWGTVYLSVSADGYETKTGSMSGGEGSTVSKTFRLTPQTIEEPPVEDPVDDPPVEDPPVDDPPVEEPVEDPVDDPGEDPPAEDPIDISEPVIATMQTYSLFTGLLGIGVYLFGTVRREEQ